MRFSYIFFQGFRQEALNCTKLSNHLDLYTYQAILTGNDLAHPKVVKLACSFVWHMMIDGTRLSRKFYFKNFGVELSLSNRPVIWSCQKGLEALTRYVSECHTCRFFFLKHMFLCFIRIKFGNATSYYQVTQVPFQLNN